jgi:hypothetical protein
VGDDEVIIVSDEGGEKLPQQCSAKQMGEEDMNPGDVLSFFRLDPKVLKCVGVIVFTLP